ncbi:sigma-70 family RNA polymerase sigma factor [Streptomyces sp. NPDC060194]|uniref:sigma-70 family RNA polymerase sigma factor n=1 Tax=Streptomyces sp. NPDC060194 TaxID=3347069 RepID=UPI00365FCF29
MARDAAPRWDRKMQQRLAYGEAAALGELYDRFAPLVHSIANRVLGDEEAADRITRDVFGHVWEHADAFDPKHGPLRTWLATLAHQRSVGALRETESRALEAAGGPAAREELELRVRRASIAARADFIVHAMPAPLRDALRLAHFQRRDYRQTAEALGVTELEARRRLRLGLQLLATARTHSPADPDSVGPAHADPSPYGRTP